MTKTTENEKLLLRRRFTRIRDTLSPEERAVFSSVVCSAIAALPEFQSAATVLLYRAVRSELSLGPLTAQSASRGKRFAYPKCLPDNRLAAFIPGSWTAGPFGIPEPDLSVSEEVLPASVDLVICPGAAFDDSCRRLGMGGGYYDRFLPECKNAVVLMAAFECQRAEQVPTADFDIPMDLIVTEQNVFRKSK